MITAISSLNKYVDDCKFVLKKTEKEEVCWNEQLTRNCDDCKSATWTKLKEKKNQQEKIIFFY